MHAIQVLVHCRQQPWTVHNDSPKVYTLPFPDDEREATGKTTKSKRQRRKGGAAQTDEAEEDDACEEAPPEDEEEDEDKARMVRGDSVVRFLGLLFDMHMSGTIFCSEFCKVHPISMKWSRQVAAQPGKSQHLALR